jgi:O-acetyl-ADP-ribose deacetylase (regulator of RNase III)
VRPRSHLTPLHVDLDTEEGLTWINIIFLPAGPVSAALQVICDRCDDGQMAHSAAIPHADLVVELRLVRERGLLRLRGAALPALTAATAALRLSATEGLTSSSVAALLDQVIISLGEGTLATATAYTFGLASGTRDWPAQDRRRRSAEVYGVTPERFRKHQERLIVEHVAEEILRLCLLGAKRDGEDGPPALSVGARRRLVLTLPAGEGHVTVCRMPVQALRNVDILVSSENIYLEMSKIFKSSLSASLRSAAALRNEVGELLDDVLQRELHAWVRAHGREGLSVAPGTVVPTSSGELAALGVRRVYHAATAIPKTHTNDYDVEPTGVLHAVRNVFRLARQERALFSPPLASICFPLFGAGRGGLEPEISFAYLWPGLEPEICRDWDIHLLTRSAAGCTAVLRGLNELGARSAEERLSR